MAYSDFTLTQLQQRFGLRLDGTTDLFADVAELDLPPELATTLQRYMPVARDLSTEKARSELLVMPFLMELKLQHYDKLSVFSGIDFTVDAEVGLNGRCDFIISRSAEQLELQSPACVLVEAKKEDIVAGVPQCLAEMIAAQRFNQRADRDVPIVYGAVTTGFQWRFLSLQGTQARIDAAEYAIQLPRRLFGVLTHIALGEEAPPPRMPA